MAENSNVEISSDGITEGSNKEHNKTTQDNNNDDHKFVFAKFVDQRGKSMVLRVKRNSTFGVAFETYRRSNDLDSLPNFVYNGARLSSHITPAEVNFRNHEQIDVYTITVGG